jgi:peroxiredoxin
MKRLLLVLTRGWPLLLAACAAVVPTTITLPRTTLSGSDAQSHVLPVSEGRALTLLVFFSAACDCQTAHDARLRELAQHYRPRGVTVFAVDSELDASPKRDAAEARRRRYPFPILLDQQGVLAKGLGAEYATYAVVVDAHGRVHYRGAIDSDLAHTHDQATLYVRDALEDLLAGHEPRRDKVEALGCSLQL